MLPALNLNAFIEYMWPGVRLYAKQKEIVESVIHNDETWVPAGNMLGKDFISGLIAVSFFLTRHPVRILTTSADGPQLEAVLWGEINRFLRAARFELDADKGGPVIINHLKLRKTTGDVEADQLSYCEGRVAAKGEGLLGHHIAKTGDGIPRTLAIIDEASGVEDTAYERVTTWADRILVIGNPYTPPGGANFFEKGVRAGDIRR